MSKRTIVGGVALLLLGGIVVEQGGGLDAPCTAARATSPADVPTSVEQPLSPKIPLAREAMPIFRQS